MKKLLRMGIVIFIALSTGTAVPTEYQYPVTGRRMIGTGLEFLDQVTTSGDRAVYVIGKAVFISGPNKKVRPVFSKLELYVDVDLRNVNYRLQDPVDVANTTLSAKGTVTTTLTVIALISSGQHVVSLLGLCSPGPCEVEWVKLLWYEIEY